MAPRHRPDLDTVREAMREHDQREDEDEHDADVTEPRDEDTTEDDDAGSGA